MTIKLTKEMCDKCIGIIYDFDPDSDSDNKKMISYNMGFLIGIFEMLKLQAEMDENKS